MHGKNILELREKDFCEFCEFSGLYKMWPFVAGREGASRRSAPTTVSVLICGIGGRHSFFGVRLGDTHLLRFPRIPWFLCSI